MSTKDNGGNEPMKSQQCGCLNKTGIATITVDMSIGDKFQCDQFCMVSHLDEDLQVVNGH